MEYRELAEKFLDAKLRYSRHPMQRELSGMADGELYALYYLFLTGGCALPRELSETMSVSGSRIAVLLTDLERKGFAVRDLDSSDRRRIHVHITEAGKAYLAERRGHILDFNEELFRRLGKRDAEEYVRIVSRISHILSDPEKNGEDA